MAEDKDWKPSYPPKAKGLPILEYLAMMGAIAAGKKITTHSKSGHPLELPVVAGEDYETEGVDIYAKTDQPYINTRTNKKYDMRVMEPVPDTDSMRVVHTPPMQGEGEMTTYDMNAPDSGGRKMTTYDFTKGTEGDMIEQVLDSDKPIMGEVSPPSDEELLKVIGYLRQMGIMR